MALGVVGREAELTEVEGFLDASAGGFAALVLEGEAGIGKTTVWRDALRRARERGTLVLKCRPAVAEAKMSFAALGDLLSEVDDRGFTTLPAPQHEALQVALLRTSPSSGSGPGRAVAAGFLGLVRALSASQTVVLAVDDWQWLDLPSRHVLEFAARRLESERVGLLGSIRSPATGPLIGGAVAEDRLRRLTVGRLSLAALGRILAERLGRPLPRPLLVRIAAVTAGNPFYALEIGRMVGEHDGDNAAWSALPVPDDLRKLTAARFRGLPAETREAVLLAAVVPDPDSRSVDLAALATAEDAGLMSVDESGRVRFAHPLFATAAYGSISAARRRALHGRAAQLVADPEQQARHLALASEHADAAVAGQLDEAAGLAASRGAPDAAAELAELAARLTPEDDPAGAGRRLVAAARFHFVGGDLTGSEERLRRVLAASPPDPVRAQALQLLAHLHGRRNNFTQASELVAQALAVPGIDERLRARVEMEAAYCNASLGNLTGAAELAQSAAVHAEAVGDDGLLGSALGCLTILGFIMAQGLDEERLARSLSLKDDVEAPIVLRPRYFDGVIRLWMGDLDRSLDRLDELYEETVEHGQEGSAPMLLLYMVQGRLAKGELPEAERLVEKAREAAVLLDDTSVSAIALGASALFHAYDGSSEQARADALEALSLFQRVEWRAGAIWPMWALGLLELSLGQPAAVDRILGPLAEQLLAFGMADPSFLVFVPDEVEALVALGELDRAERYLEPFERAAQQLERNWAIAIAHRCQGLLQASRGEPETALAEFQRALSAHEHVGMPLERARTLLLAGETYRRFKQRRHARDLLEEALREFERMRAPLWAEKARQELARIGRPAGTRDQLTETESRLAQLAAGGLSNQEIAERAFVSVKTVEANLTRVYRKLGVRSRVGLANALQGREGALGDPAAQLPQA